MDYFTFIVHVFTPQTRAFYSLERLWGDAERIEIRRGESAPVTIRRRTALGLTRPGMRRL